ncbi:MAG: hypothetical protein ROR55_21225 [Devosia sp.]
MTDQATHEFDAKEGRKIDAEIAKLIAETAKINAEARFYPYIVVLTAVGAFAALVKIFA